MTYIPPMPTPFLYPLITTITSFQKKKKMDAIQSWVSHHKLTTIGTLWASGVGGSLVYSAAIAKTPLKPSLRLIHARMHAQALTLAVLSGAAVYHHYYDQKHVTAGPTHTAKAQ